MFNRYTFRENNPWKAFIAFWKWIPKWEEFVLFRSKFFLLEQIHFQTGKLKKYPRPSRHSTPSPPPPPPPPPPPHTHTHTHTTHFLKSTFIWPHFNCRWKTLYEKPLVIYVYVICSQITATGVTTADMQLFFSYSRLILLLRKRNLCFLCWCAIW